MSVSYTAATQNNNKCPHGFPIGSCPICSGMGGAPKDRNKARKPGEMTYNECMAAWRKIQAQKEAKLQEKIDKAELLRNNALKDRLSEALSKAQRTLEKYSTLLNNSVSKMPLIVKLPVKLLVIPVINLISNIPKIINTLTTFVTNAFNSATQFIASVAEKLSSFLGEIKNLKDFKKSLPKLKKAFKTMLSLFIENKEDEDEKQDRLKTFMKNLFKPKELKEKEKEKEDEHHHN